MKTISKNIKTLLFAMIMLLFSINSFAHNTGSTIKIINPKEKIFRLVLEDARTKDHTVRISDASGSILLEEEILASKKVARVYNLSELNVGKYKIEIEGDSYIREQIVEVTFNNLEVLGKAEVKIFKPVISMDGNMMLLNMFAQGKEKVTISFFDINNDSLFSEVIKDRSAIHKGYDLSELPEGKYTVSVSIKGRSFRTVIKLQKPVS